MSRSKWSSRLGLVSLVSGQCLWLAGCDQTQIPSALSTIQQVQELSETEEQPRAIHVEGVGRGYATAASKEEQQIVKTKQTLIAMLYPEGGNETLSQFLETVEVELLEFLVEQDLEILTQPSLEAYHTNYSTHYGEIEGVYIPEKNQLLLKELPTEAFEELLKEQFYHEVGHVVDTKLGDLAMTEAFKLLAEEGVDLIFPESDTNNAYYRENVWEYFAESFNLFFKNPAQLANHEETYKYICSVIEQIHSI